MKHTGRRWRPRDGPRDRSASTRETNRTRPEASSNTGPTHTKITLKIRAKEESEYSRYGKK